MTRTQLRLLFLISLAISCCFYEAEAQREPVTWLISFDSVATDQGVLTCSAKILPGWHLYSQHIREGGPMPTKFVYSQDGYKTIGQTSEKGKRTTYHDELYDMEVVWYSEEVIFTQRVQKFKPKTFVKGTIDYMVCNGEVCMPGRKAFSVPIIDH
jgi:hypothetical protein